MLAAPTISNPDARKFAINFQPLISVRNWIHKTHLSAFYALAQELWLMENVNAKRDILKRHFQILNAYVASDYYVRVS